MIRPHVSRLHAWFQNAARFSVARSFPVRVHRHERQAIFLLDQLIIASAALTGAGLVSMNKSLNNG